MDIISYLKDFKKIHLTDMKSVELMNRIDKKFVFKSEKLPKLLNELSEFYNILEVNGNTIQEYKSLYYDTEDRTFFLEHHNERVNRYKVRFREYVGSNLFFLEIKCKNNKGKTLKKRIKVDEINKSLNPEQLDYIRENIGNDLNLTPKQWINFNRITLVDKSFSERLTIDLNLTFSNEVKSDNFNKIVIAELKKEQHMVSKFVRIAKKHNIYPTRLSKYCMSTIKLEPRIKQNRFKKKLLLINKLNS